VLTSHIKTAIFISPAQTGSDWHGRYIASFVLKDSAVRYHRLSLLDADPAFRHGPCVFVNACST